MAVSTSEDTAAEIAASLSVEDVPVKLRCATCSLIAYNALRLPCCEQNICETCHNELVDVCQVCHHEPLDKSLCTPNKSLRTTTKVFLKRKLLEREKDQKKRESEAATPHGTDSNHVAAATPALEIANAGGVQNAYAEGPLSATSQSNQPVGKFPSGSDTGHAADDTIEPDRRSPEEGDIQVAQTSEQDDKPGFNTQEASAGAEQGGQWSQGAPQNAVNQQQNFNQMNGMNNMGGFPMDMSTMMAMGAMPNMMGMGMDPMMMNAMASSMFGGFAGPNMDMGGMNMGMGQSQFGGPWMADQDSYNGNAQGNARFGNQSGYNMPSHQGNFNQMNQQFSYNDFQSGYGRPGFYARGRGRRGGFRGGYAYQHQGHVNQGNYNHGNNNFPNNHQAQHQEASGSTKTDQQSNPANTDAQASLEKSEEDQTAMPGDSDKEAVVADQERDNAEATALAVDDANGAADEDQVGSDKPKPIQSFISDEPSRNPPSGPSGAPVGPSNNALAPMQGHRFPEPRTIGVPGAPTGPRALREGLPNTGRSGLAYSRPPHTPTGIGNVPSRRSKSPSPVKEIKSTHRSRSRSPSRERVNRRQSYRRRSHSESSERRQDQSEKTYEENAQPRTYNDDEERQNQDRGAHQSDRHRDGMEVETRTHHDEKDYDRESPDRGFGRDYDREYTPERQGERQHYKNDDYRRDTGDDGYYDRRSRSLSPRRESPPPRDGRKDGESRKRRNRDDDYEEDNGHGRGHSRRERHRRKRSRRHRSTSRDRGSRYQPPDREDGAGRRDSLAANAGNHPPTGPREDGRSRGDERRRNRRQRRDSGGGKQQANAPAAPEKDPHTLEREARDRERLMKEMQRRATADGGRGQRDNDRRRGSGQYEGDSSTAPRKDRGGRRRR